MKNLDCLLPWFCFSITTELNGQVCCTNKFPVCNIDKNTILEKIWKQNILEIRNDFLENKIPPTCIPCYTLESFGLRSRRKRFNERLNQYMDPVNFSNPKIQFLDIVFSNICNLNCVMCSSEYSTQWIKYDKEFIKYLPFRKSIEPFLKENKLCKEFIDQIIIKDLKIVEVKGGEPLIDSRFNYFLNRFLKENGAGIIHITSNLNVLTNEMKKQLRLLPSVAFDISIDGIGDLYKYIRGNNSSINKVEKNLKFLIELENIISIRINVTTVPYNIWDSYKIIKWANNISKKIKINWCPMCIEPSYLNPIVIPFHIREKAAEEFEEYIKINDINSDYIIDLNYTLEYLKNKNPQNLNDKILKQSQQNFIKWTDEINKMRNMDIYQIVPSMKIVKDLINGSLE